MDTGRRTRLGSGRRRAVVRAGQGGIHDHRTMDRGGGHPGCQEGLCGLRELPVSDRPDAITTLRLRRGLHDQCEVRQPRQVGRADRLHRQAGDAEGTQDLRSTVTGAEPDQKELPLSYQWSQGPGKQTFYTIQDQAFPKKVADQYFSIQSAVLQGKTSPAEAAKQMQDAVSAWAKS